MTRCGEACRFKSDSGGIRRAFAMDELPLLRVQLPDMFRGKTLPLEHDRTGNVGLILRLSWAERENVASRQGQESFQRGP